MAEQLGLVLPPRLDVEDGREVVADVGRPVAALHDLPVEPARSAVGVEVRVPRVRVAVDHARDLVRAGAPHRLRHVGRRTQLRRDVGPAAVVEEQLELVEREDVGHERDPGAEPGEVGDLLDPHVAAWSRASWPSVSRVVSSE